jgi:hypothetical protein
MLMTIRFCCQLPEHRMSARLFPSTVATCEGPSNRGLVYVPPNHPLGPAHPSALLSEDDSRPESSEEESPLSELEHCMSKHLRHFLFPSCSQLVLKKVLEP